MAYYQLVREITVPVGTTKTKETEFKMNFFIPEHIRIEEPPTKGGSDSSV